MAERVRGDHGQHPGVGVPGCERRGRRSSTLREHELPGVPVVDGEGRLVGIVTEADLVLPDDQGDLHIPHYVNLFGGTVFLEPLGRFEKRLRKAFASTAADMMTSDPDAVGPDTTVRDAARLIHDSGHNRLPGGRRRRAARGRRSRAWTCWAPWPGERRRARARSDRPRRHRAQLPRRARRPAGSARAVRRRQGRRLRARRGAGGRAAALRGGATWLAVATAAEARRAARARASTARLLVMGALTAAELREAVDSDADVVVWTRELAAAAAALAGARLHVKLDTGMGRLGTEGRGARARAPRRRRGGRHDPFRDRGRAR